MRNGVKKRPKKKRVSKRNTLDFPFLRHFLIDIFISYELVYF